MKNKGKRIYIANLIFVSGGTLVLSTLCGTLRKLGYDAKLIIRDYQHYDNHQKPIFHTYINIKIAVRLFLMRYGLLPEKYRKSKNTTNIQGLDTDYKILTPTNKSNSIIIYPEIIFGNPLKIKNVVRFMMFHHKFYSRPNTYKQTDKFIAFRPKFNDFDLNPDEVILKLNYFDKNLYQQYNFGERKGNCYIIYKGKNRKDLPSSFDGKVFWNIDSQEDFVKTLNECKYCYSYDPQSYYNIIAAVCGCIPIVVLEPGKTVEDYLTPEEKHLGIAYGNTPEQIEYAINTREKLLASLEYEKSNIDNTKKFVEYLESNFGGLRRLKTRKN